MGSNYVAGTLNWSGGAVAGPLTIATNGVLNINGTVNLCNALTNAGTVNWLAGTFYLDANGGYSDPIPIRVRLSIWRAAPGTSNAISRLPKTMALAPTAISRTPARWKRLPRRDNLHLYSFQQHRHGQCPERNSRFRRRR